MTTTAPDLLDALAAVVGRRHLRRDPATRDRLAADAMRAGRAALGGLGAPATPLAVVRPGTTAEVAAVLRLATAEGVAVVPYGGGTGLMGGARTVRPGIVLDLRRLDRVLAVEPEDRTAVAQAGVVIAALNTALAPHGLVCGHDPWTVPIATVGGTLSTHGLGYLGGRYGSIADQLLGLEVVLADGSVVRTRPAEQSATGPPLRWLWVGAEGTLGVITEATLRVFPRPEREQLAALDFPDFAAGFAAVCAMAAIGLHPAMIDFGAPPAGRRGGGRMVLASHGFAEAVAAEHGRALALCARHGGVPLDPAEAEAFWAARHVSAARLGGWRRAEATAAAPGEPGSEVSEYMHLVLPQSQVLAFLADATARFAEAGGAVGEWGLWHRPELISLVARARTDTPAALARFAAAHDDVIRLAQARGGSMEYVHGVGLRLAPLVEAELAGSIAALRRVKAALDPAGILNPDKLGLAETK